MTYDPTTVARYDELLAMNAKLSPAERKKLRLNLSTDAGSGEG